VQTDHVDEILDQWRHERPSIDVSGMAVVGRISRLAKELQPRLDAVFAAHGLESWEFDVLATLLRTGAPHQLTPGELLRSTMVTSGAMTNRLQRLEARGLIERRPSPTDGRQVLVVLTTAGRRLVDAALVDHAANLRTLLAGLDREQEDRLVELLRLLGTTLCEPPS
jgi:DNA-binding MarR family transcriptional regulator